MSFYTSLSGLQASQKEMSTISHNLANVATDGFKKSRTEFADVIASSVSSNPNSLVGSGVVTKSIRQEFGQGNMKQTGGSLDLAVSGDGFFAVKPNPSMPGVNYTRNGNFLIDANNNVVDGQGNFLQVYPVDGSGTVVATDMDSLVPLTLPPTNGTPRATSAVVLDLNLNGKSEVPAKTPFDRFDPNSYNQSSVTTVYDAAGNPMTMTSYYVRETAPVPSAPPAPDDLTATWSVYTFVGDQQMVSGTADAIALQFNQNGELQPLGAPVVFDSFMPQSEVSQQQISLDFAATTTQLTTPFKVSDQMQDGVSVGELQGVNVDAKGFVIANYSNGDTVTLGQIAVVNFANPTGLRQLGNSAWAATGVSGEPVLGIAGEDGMGNLMSGMIEGSNVDITEELVALIAAQRNFQANAKALDTSSQISQTIFNMRG